MNEGEKNMLKKTSIFLIVVLTLVLTGCQPAQSDDFAIYLLTQDISAVKVGQIDLDQLALESEPIISSDDMISYEKSTHKIELTPATYTRVQQIFPMPDRLDGIPFVVCVGKERIYSGGFWTPLSSLSYDGVVIMQPWDTEETTIQISLGYSTPNFFTGNDPRADPRIMNALEQANKLK
jgi:hypothetical protein